VFESWIRDTLGIAISDALLLLAVVVFVIMPLHVWWYKHRDRPLFATWIVAVFTYLSVLAPVGLAIWLWSKMISALALSPDQASFAGLIAAGVAIVAVNIAWWSFLRYLKSAPKG